MDVFSPLDVGRAWPVPGQDVDKYARGVVGIDTGSTRYPGAAVLTVLGALYAGAGFIRYCGTDVVRRTLVQVAPSVTFGQGRVSVWLVGCGWSGEPSDEERLTRRFDDGVPMVLDAGALDHLPVALPSTCLLTPHAGELARLLGVARSVVQADPAAAAQAAASRTGATVLVKGHRQYVATADGGLIQAVGGPAWTAQAGSGDLLAGIAAALIAQGCTAPIAGVLAASIQAMAAATHPGPYPPHELIRHLPSVIAHAVQAAGRLDRPDEPRP
ncbi:MAG: NAD(P)H-hydrate dehydratase [Propionibacteriaceae bacterium]|jgi:hydroxyethylthiazole kinase-like uncharacterized protein yjeF|nr:NAD(P)H-hydrate dehydratase [Propionibacteriaceae bacterium]